MSPFGIERQEAEAIKEENQKAENKMTSMNNKCFARVIAEHRTDGSVRPLSFTLQDETNTLFPEGEEVVVDRLLSVRAAASLKAGGQGLRYEVRVTCGEDSRVMYLFDEDGIWFVEGNDRRSQWQADDAQRQAPDTL